MQLNNQLTELYHTAVCLLGTAVWVRDTRRMALWQL